MYDPIAIVGIAFRFPGDLNDEQTFWNALTSGCDLVGRIPSDRWAIDELQHDRRSEPGRSITFSAGVLSRLDEFDADFFGISPREAIFLDPQHRLLLELSWEAMENAGIAPASLSGTDCAVYVGISSTDYAMSRADDLAVMTAHSITGTATSMAANRISYVFDLRGPSLAVDTACSSSLVALHHACTSLHTGDASAALVGGVSVLLHPSSFIGFTKASMLSATGRCRPFDADGDGYVRAEGGAVLLLKPLERAVADGDTIQAVILATGVNTDGARKTGLTVPSRDAQAELLRQVLSKSGLSGTDIDFVEAHGTGTAVGDPVEALAIGAVYGKGRAKPLPISSVKANLGHLEPASGMAGLIKAVLALKNHALPPLLHFHTPNPRIDFSDLGLDVVTSCQPLQKENDQPLHAGVNSFGFGGSNAHVILQEYCFPVAQKKPVDQNKIDAATLPPLFISAHTDAALTALAQRYANHLRGMSAADFYDLAHTAAYGRDRLSKRLGLMADTPEKAADMLSEYAKGHRSKGPVVENALLQTGSVAFVYAGNGAQWVGMGRRLLTESPRFLEIITDLDTMIKPLGDFSVMEELLADDGGSRLEDTAVAQPLLFAVQVAITLLLEDLGIKPAAVAGHSAGEVAAAWAAGALQLDEAVRVIVARSVTQGTTAGMGAMAAVAWSEGEARTFLREHGRMWDVSIAAINSPTMITLSGMREDLDRIRLHLKSTGKKTFFQFLGLDYAFHSRHMDGLKSALAKSLGNLKSIPNAKAIFVSTVNPDQASGSLLDANYWWRNVREPVQFQAAVTKLAELGCRVFVEIGPDAVLQRYIRTSLSECGIKGRVLSTLRKKSDGLENLFETALRVHLIADKTDTGVFFPTTGKRVRLPNTPWQKERYWISSTSESLHALDRRRVHPLLGWQLPETETTWENVLDPVVLPWLSDHRVDGAIVFPGAAYAEMALAAAREWLKTEFPAVEELDMVSPLVFDDDHARTVRFILNPRDGGFQIKSRQRLSADPWTLHATGRIIEAFDRPSELLAELLAKPAGPVIQRVESNVHYQLTAKVGLEYGPAFQGLVCTRRDAHRLEGRLAEQMAPDAAYEIHPALLDPCFQALVDFFQSEIESGAGTAFLPVKIGRLQLYAKDRVAGFRAHLRGWNTRSALADFQLLGPEEKILATLTGCRFRAAVLRPANAPNPDIWRTVPYLTPHPAEHPNTALPASETLAGICRQALAGSGPGRWKWFRETLPLLEALALAFIHDAVRKLTEKDPDGVSRLVSAHSGYAWWLAELLVREGLVAHCENTWQLKSDRDFTDSIDIWRTLLHDAPTCFPQLTRMGRVGLHLPELLTGQVDSAAFLETLSRSSLTETVDSDPAGWGMQQAVAGILRHLAADIPANRRLRVLECTSTRPGPYSRLLQSLIQNDRLDYVVVLEDAAVRDRAQAEYRDGARITVGTLDLLHWTLSAEKVLPVCFDVIIMDQILHRAPDPFAAMEKTLGWIAPGGALLLVERHPDWSVDFVQGLDPSWWRPVPSPDDSSCDVSWRSSLCPPETWQKALQESGYDDVVCFTEPEAEGLAEGACLLIAKRPQHDVIHPLAALAAPPAHAWLLLAHGDAATFLAKRLKERLEAGGQQVQVTDALNTADPGNIHHVVWFSGWNHGVDEAPELLSRLLGDVQALGGWASTPPRLWIVTCGGALVSGPWGPAVASRAPNPAQTAIWGFGRVVMNEYPALGCRLVDIAGDPDAADMPARLEQELLYPDGADEIVLADTGRYTLEVTKEKKSDVAICGHPSPAELRFRLDFRVPGQLRNLLWLPEAEKPLAADQVEVRTHATGLNFRDVMFLMGLLPEEAVEKGFSGSSLGLEFSGIVTRTGAEVNTVCPGDAVMGFGPSAFASHVVTRADAVVPIPDGWSFESAATVPTVFFTAYYALVQLADLQPGERVLIHGAAGGVGMAAIQLARHRGAEIFATAGNAIKRDIVRLLGADQVFDSRSLAFEEEILTRTGGEGVDVVLNSLAGEAVRRNLNLLKPFGRFLELGKRDFVENTPIGLRPFKDNISYFAVDVDQLLIHRPRLAGQVLGEVMDLFRQGILSPLPWRGFSAKQVESAFRCMQQANHMGKVVVVFDSARPPVSFPVDAKPPVRLEPVCFEKDSTWLVTGGLSGFGLETARWLAAQGAGTVVLLGRRGTQSAEAVQAAEELAACGATLQIRACDVTDRAALAAILEEIRLSLPPLKGIVHAAMVMDDGLMANMDAQSLQAVLGPKLLGAWYLHTLTLDIPLDYFVLFSSITTLIGNPGQANYVAANAGLEGLCALRQQMELPVTCVGWGPIGDVGYLARHTAVRDSLCGRLGGAPLTSAEALDQLGAALLREDGPLAVARLDWNTLSRHLPSAGSPRFAALGRGRKQTPADNETADVRALIAGKTRDAALELVGALVVDEVAHILCLSPERINADRSLQDLGMDSLMAVELALALEKRFGILFPVMMLGESPSIQKVSVRIVDKLMGGEESASPDMLSAKLGDLAYHHGESVSPDQVKHILQDAQMTAEHDPIQEV